MEWNHFWRKQDEILNTNSLIEKTQSKVSANVQNCYIKGSKLMHCKPIPVMWKPCSGPVLTLYGIAVWAWESRGSNISDLITKRLGSHWNPSCLGIKIDSCINFGSNISVNISDLIPESLGSNCDPSCRQWLSKITLFGDNKIEGTRILKLEMVKRLWVKKIVKKYVKKNHQKIS